MHNEAHKLLKSRKGLNVRNTVASQFVNTNAVIACSRMVKSLVSELEKLKGNLWLISGEDKNDGISNNEVLNFYLEHVREE